MRLSRLLVASPSRLAAVGAFLAVLVAALARGRVHPDEVFQYLEPAHGLVFGYRVVAWEWVDGLRNWAVPGVLAGLLALCRALGLEHPWAMMGVVWCACASVQAVGTLLLFRLVEERDGREAALLAAGVHATWGGFLIYAARPLGDVLSVVPLLGALLWACRARDRDGALAGLWCGVLLGVAFVIRYPSAVFGVPITVSLVWARRWRSFAGFSVGAGVVLLGLGVLDWLTWGTPWASAWNYFHFNISSGSSASQFGRQPAWWYAPILAGMAPLLLVWHFARGLARRELLVGAFVFYLGVLCVLGHKEARFLVPLLPLFVALAAGPAARDLAQLASRRAVGGVLLGLYVLSSALAATVTLPFGLRAGVIDGTVVAGRDAALTGLVIAGPPEWNTGGRFYLHRDVPVFVGAGHSEAEVRERLADARFSHALVEGKAVGEDTLRATGFCLERRGRGAALWKRCPTPFG
ncbi:mannosyltransferase [Archangium violaceum]|nr:mannosyltransferase [Archangium violaceum]